MTKFLEGQAHGDRHSLHAPLIPVLVALVCAVPVQAQQADTVRLDEVVVTATRLPTRVGATAAAVTVITGEELRLRGVRHVTDALRAVPGVSVAQSAGPGALTTVFMRGGESDYVQVLVDGVQVNDAGGLYNWAHLRVEDVERIEVVRGPVSVLYGSDAVAGVIQVFTRRGGAPELSASAAGSRGDRHGAAGGAYGTGSVDGSATGTAQLAGAAVRYGATAAHTRSSGLYEYNSDYDNTLLSGRIGVEHGRGEVQLSARATLTEYHYPTNGSGAVLDHNQFATSDAIALGIDAGYRFTDAFELRLLATQHTTSGRTENPPDSEADGSSWNTAEQARRSVDVRGNVRLPRSTVLTLGAEREWQEEVTELESISSFGTFTAESDEARANTGVYAQLHGSLPGDVAVTLGGRIDDNEKFGRFRTGRAGVSWQLSNSARVHGAWGTAFKEPTFYEQFAEGFVLGNAALEPEQSRSIEAGLHYALHHASLSITAFDQRFTNLIQFTGNPAPGQPNYFNIGAARARGAELGVSARFGSVNARAAWTYTTTKVTDAGFGEDNLFQQDQRLVRRPEHVATLGIDAALARSVRGLIDVRAAGEREDLDFTSEWQGARTTLPAYAIADVGALYTYSAAELSLRVRNLLDARYQEIYNFPAPGRVLEAGVRLRF